jgi:dCTP deaminase
MILSDRDIQRRLQDGSLTITPIDNPEQQIQPASVDLRLGNEFIVWPYPQEPSHIVDVRSQDSITRNQASWKAQPGMGFLLRAGEFALGTTIERVSVPFDLVGRLEGRSSVARLGLIVHAAGWIDPGFRGQITLELRNISSTPIRLWPDMRICQIAFHELTTPVDRPYGHMRGSKYQEQVGTVGSRIFSDLLSAGESTGSYKPNTQQ